MNNINYDSAILKDNQIWQDTYNIYIKNELIFNSIITNIENKYGMDNKTAKDALLYEIMSCQYGFNKHYKKASYVKWGLIYLGIFVFILLNTIISSIIYSFIRQKNVDLLYEEMWPTNSLYNRFYNYIDHELKSSSLKKAILFITPSFKIDTYSNPPKVYKNKVINRRFANMFFYHSLGIKNFMKDLSFVISLLSYSKKSSINIIYIYLRFIRKLLIYSSQAAKVKSTVLISASDYYWNPVKYFFYKNNIKNIILIQHNFVNDYLHLRLFQYCDYYYAHSNQSILKHEFCGNAKFYNIGSFQLIPFLNQQNIEYDILFISQPVHDNLLLSDPFLDQNKLIHAYNLLIENFYTLLKNNPHLNAVYVTKSGNMQHRPATEDKKTLSVLNNLRFESTNGKETFNLVSKSKLIINMYSSVGFESYGLNKKVLWINYNRSCDVFKYDTENEDLHVMINDTSYDSFEKRVNLLLSESKEIDEHYRKLKEKYMNIQENPAKIVSDKIYEILESPPSSRHLFIQ